MYFNWYFDQGEQFCSEVPSEAGHMLTAAGLTVTCTTIDDSVCHVGVLFREDRHSKVILLKS
jgi:hypothetical protein